MENGNRVAFYKCTPLGSDSRRVEIHRKIKKVTDIDNHRKDKAVPIDDHQIVLHVMIVKAEGIDNPNLHPLVSNRHYNVVYWVVPGEELRTKLTDGIDPLWNEKGMIFLDNLDDHVYLNVEVQRFNSKVDPGTSCGRVVVGRARIPFPKELYRKRTGYFTLVRTEGEHHKAEGQIVLVMRLERIKINPPYF